MDGLKQFLLYKLSAGPIEIVVWEVLYVVGLLLTLAAILNKFLFKPVIAVLDQRAALLAKATGAQDASLRLLEEKDRQLTERTIAARREAAATVEQAKREADAERQALVSQARAKADHQLAVARTTMATASKEAEAELKGKVDQLARLLASRLLGREVA